MAESRKYYYLKIKETFFNDEQMIVLESLPDGCMYSNILLKLYLCSLPTGTIRVSSLLKNSPPQISLHAILSHRIHVPVEAICAACAVFEELGIAEITEEIDKETNQIDSIQIAFPEVKVQVDTWSNPPRRDGVVFYDVWHRLYAEYLQSDEWKEKRSEAMWWWHDDSLDVGICYQCKKEPAEHVHHLTYERVKVVDGKLEANERPEDLIPVCASCHNKLHGREIT